MDNNYPAFTHGLPQYISEVKKDGRVTGYKYQRRVPRALQELHPIEGTQRLKKMWDYYLGADLIGAVIKAHELRWKHDYQIEQFTNNLPEVIIKGVDSLIADQVSMHNADGSARAPSWRDAEHYPKNAKDLPDGMEKQALAAYAATSFGDQTYVNEMQLNETFSQLARVPANHPPAEGTELLMFNVMKEALDTRLSQLQVKSNDPAARISNQMEQYINYKRSAENTARGYRGLVARFVAFAGDLELS